MEIYRWEELNPTALKSFDASAFIYLLYDLLLAWVHGLWEMLVVSQRFGTFACTLAMSN